jgi:thiol-disulfide isomerase/thioredoxin
MKKAILLFFLSFILFNSELSAQLADGSIAPDFTLTDINGNSHHLYGDLALGKPVFLEFFTTWCVPCQLMHDYKILQTIDSIYGPNGSYGDAVRVLSVECDVNTTNADLYSPTDFVTGMSYPIADLNNSNISIASDYQIAFVPTTYVICPDHKAFVVPNYLIVDTFLIRMATSCDWNLDLLTKHVDPRGRVICGGTVNPSVMVSNNGSTNVTQASIQFKLDNSTPQTYNWTGLLLPGDSTDVTLPNLNASQTGAHTLFVRTVTANGITDDFPADDIDTSIVLIENSAPQIPPYVQGFSGNFPPSGMMIYNPGCGPTWKKDTLGGFGNSQECISISWMNSTENDLHDDFYLPPVDLQYATSASLSYSLAVHKSMNTYNRDTLWIQVSTDCGATWSTVNQIDNQVLFSDSVSQSYPFVPTDSSWITQNINLGAFLANGNVLIRFALSSNFGSDWFFDDININAVTGIEESLADNLFSVFPNPVNDQLNVGFNLDATTTVTVNVYNTIGKLVSSRLIEAMAAGKQTIQISTAGFENGMYMVELIAGENREVKRVTVVH